MADPTASGPDTFAAPRSEGPGGHVGPYKLLSRLGEGGFGDVFEAEQTHPVRRRVAVKLIKPGMDSRDVIARFEAERQALALMDHPHIAKVFGAGASEDGRPYFAMELVKGEPVTGYCDRHTLTVAARLALFVQVCEAVQHAHTKGIIHRDLKPSNVLVATHDDRPFAKVIDFGIAKAVSGRLGERTLYTEQNHMIGTPLYMSPEQAEGSADIDTRTDIYALGVLLYELLTGTTPVQSATLRSATQAEVQRIIREVDPPRPSARLSASGAALPEVASRCRTEPVKLRRIVRGELDWIVMKAIEKDRVRRYDSASALAADVDRYLCGEPVLAAPPSVVYRTRKFLRRNKGVVVAASLVTLSLLGGLIGFAWQAKLARQHADELEQMARFQESMFEQVDTAVAGRHLSDSVLGKLDAALRLQGVSDAERLAQVAAFEVAWRQVNTVDTARDLIDATILKPSVAAIDQQFRDQPRLEAALRQVLADRYRSFGLYEAALPLQQQALEARRALLGEDDPNSVDSLRKFGVLLLEQGRLEEAEQILGETLAQQRRLFGEDDQGTLATLGDLGWLLFQQGKLDQAERYLRETLARSRRVLGEEHPDTLFALHILGALANAQGNLEEAELYHREALLKKRRVLGEEHPDTLASLSNLASLLQSQGRLDEAESYFREALEKQRRALGEEHPETLTSLNNLGVLLLIRGQFDEAERYVRETLDVQRRMLGETHPSTLVSTGNLGGLLLDQGRLDEAEGYIRAAWDLRQRVLGPEHPDNLLSMLTLARLLNAQGKPDEALDLLLPVEPRLRETFAGGRAFRLAQGLSQLGHAHAALGQFAPAEEKLLEGQRLFAESPGGSRRDRRDNLSSLIRLYAERHAIEPDQGHDAKTAQWQRVRDEFDR